ncbi:pilus assembly protein PilM [Candidatus Kaiserbacteria bacterium]|nr:pilus assembly protein PilM [Candidatus Kaiserbacteria bacterium]
MFNLTSLLSGHKKNVTPNNVVGIDFGSSSIKVVELEKRKDLVVLKTYGEIQLGPYADSELGKPVKLDEKKKTQALTDVINESGVSAESGLLSMPLSSSFVTIMSMTAKPEEDIGPRVRVEARKYIPIPLADVTLDWTELPPLGNVPDNVREILVVAVQNDPYSEMTSVMQSVQKFVQPAESELFSAVRALSKPKDRAVAILDLGAETSKMYIIHQGMLRKIHRVRIGGSQATDRIMELTGLSHEAAENAKRNFSPDMENSLDIKKAVISTFERPLQEFKRVLTQNEMKVGEKVERVILTGGSASFGEMVPFSGYMLDRTVERANAFSKVAYPAFMESRLQEIAPSFTVALGGALRSFEN